MALKYQNGQIDSTIKIWKSHNLLWYFDFYTQKIDFFFIPKYTSFK